MKRKNTCCNFVAGCVFPDRETTVLISGTVKTFPGGKFPRIETEECLAEYFKIEVSRVVIVKWSRQTSGKSAGKNVSSRKNGYRLIQPRRSS